MIHHLLNSRFRRHSRDVNRFLDVLSWAILIVLIPFALFGKARDFMRRKKK